MNTTKRKLIIVGIVVFAVILLILINNKRIINQKASKLTMLSYVPVSYTFVSTGNVSENIKLVATAYADKEINIASEISGKVKKINFQEGTYVKGGGVLLEVDDEIKKAAFENAKFLYEKAEKDLKRNEELYKSKSISETQYEVARLNYENAKNQYISTKKQYNDTKIIAPFSGYITSKFVDLGSFLNVGNVVATLTDVSNLRVRVNVSENDVFKLKVGQKIELTTDVYPNEKFYGTIRYIAPKGDEAHTFPVELIISNSSNRFKAGMLFTLNFDFSAKSNVLVIPRDAILGSVKNPYVYIVDGDYVRLKNIKVGQDLGKFVEVISGLNMGDKVVIKGKLNITDGTKVKATEEKN
jgi:RND family efflux transporter MFP subunit